MRTERIFNTGDLKRALVVFTLPDEGRYMVQEGRGATDEHLRRAIRAARKTFNRVYNDATQRKGGAQ